MDSEPERPTGSPGVVEPESHRSCPTGRYSVSMSMAGYWQTVYLTRAADQVGWFEPSPAISRRLVSDAVALGARSVIDVGGGASFLVDALLDLALERLAVLDISSAGLAVAKSRLGDLASQVEWIVGDVATTDDVGLFDVWHDRAVFHFLISRDDQIRYAALAAQNRSPWWRGDHRHVRARRPGTL